MFWRKQQENNSKLYENIKENSVEVVRLRAEVEALEQKLKTLRGLVNKKLKYEDADDNPQNEKDIKDDGFNSLRGNMIS